MPTQSFYEGTELVVESGEVALNPGAGWTELAKGSSVTRQGSLVTVAMQVKNAARAAWVEATEYAAGVLVTEGGKTWRSLVAANTGHKPATSPTFWAEVASPTLICTLPAELRPAVAYLTEDGKFEFKANGEVVSTFSLTAEAASWLPVQLSYVAASINP
jgi:Carbohydrate binding domain.